MKKYLFAFAVFFSGFAVLLSDCSSTSKSQSSVLGSSSMNDFSSDGSSSSRQGLSLLWNEDYADSASGFASMEDVKDAKFFKNGSYVDSFSGSLRAKNDNKMEFYGNDNVRYVDKSNGYALTFPLADGAFPVDYTLAKYGVRVTYSDSEFRLSNESNCYAEDEHGFGIYIGEWLDRYIANDKYLADNNLSRYAATIDRSQTYLAGYEVTIHSILVNEPGKLEKPYYKIAWIRKLGQYKTFLLVVFKSETDQSAFFNGVLSTYKTFSAFGNPKNYPGVYVMKENPSWNFSTKEFFEKRMMAFDHFDFGVFSYSMCNDDDPSFPDVESRILSEKNRLESASGMDHAYEIMPTYSHISWYGHEHTFPLALAQEFAGGNFTNGKPILQFSYQFTTNNNNVTSSNVTDCYTPMFDILRGKYDSTFKKIANGLKEYGMPVLFRLNNEMNSDWTSYCGMMTLVDPDIFIATWRYLYNLFEEEGVANAIFVFNPVTVSCPYSNWGEDLAYFPGSGYAHVLGLTNYEMNNGSTNSSFRELYTKTYEKSFAQFSKFPWFIGEFACGAGGSASGALGRNEASQASWIQGMFSDLTNRSDNAYLSNLVGAIWFSCNDSANDGTIVNYLRLDPTLTDSLQALKKGFAALTGLS